MIKRDQLLLKMLYSEEVQTFNAKDLEETLPPLIDLTRY